MKIFIEKNPEVVLPGSSPSPSEIIYRENCLPSMNLSRHVPSSGADGNPALAFSSVIFESAGRGPRPVLGRGESFRHARVMAPRPKRSPTPEPPYSDVTAARVSALPCLAGVPSNPALAFSGASLEALGR